MNLRESGANIVDSRVEEFIKHDGTRSEAMAFWTAHGSIEDDSAKWTLEALPSLEPNPSEVELATRLIGIPVWSFSDERIVRSVELGFLNAVLNL